MGAIGDSISSNKDELNGDYCLPPVETWPHRPLFLQADRKQCKGLSVSNIDVDEPLPIGEVFHFESDLFSGKGLIRICSRKDKKSKKNRKKNEKEKNMDEECDYFKNKKRQYQVVIQGKFKKEIPVSDVVAGRLYEKKLALVPPAFISSMMNKLFAKMAPGVEMDLRSSQPKVIAPYLDCVQVLSCDKEGSEPNILSLELVENNTAFGLRSGVGSKERKKIFSSPSSKHMFDTDTVYTFEQYDDLFDYSDYSLDIKIASFDMSKVVNGQPFQFNAMRKSSGEYLWLFQIWHENLLSSKSLE